jgi:hypothetical protein
LGSRRLCRRHRWEGRVGQELLVLLKQHEEAARRRVEELRAELAGLNERIAVAEVRPGGHAGNPRPCACRT